MIASQSGMIERLYSVEEGSVTGVVIKHGMEWNGMESMGARIIFMFYFFSFNSLSTLTIVVCHSLWQL